MAAASQDQESRVEVKAFKIPHDRTLDGRVLPHARGRKETVDRQGRRIATTGAASLSFYNDVGFDPETVAIRARDAAHALAPTREQMIPWSRTCRLVVTVTVEETCLPE